MRDVCVNNVRLCCPCLPWLWIHTVGFGCSSYPYFLPCPDTAENCGTTLHRDFWLKIPSTLEMPEWCERPLLHKPIFVPVRICTPMWQCNAECLGCRPRR